MSRQRIRVEGLAPSAPQRGLLAVAQTINGEEGRWTGGVEIDPYPCGCALAWDPACNADPETLEGDGYDLAEQPSREFDPFVVYQDDACSTLGGRPLPEHLERVQTTLEATQHQAIEAELWSGSLVSTNPRLASTDADELTAEAVQVADAFAVLEEAIAASCRAGVIHITPATATWAARLGLVARDGQILRTIMGTPVVAGVGYPGTGPDGSEAPPGTSWAYATGPLRVRLGPIESQSAVPAEVVRRDTNRVVVRAQRIVLVEWDRCLHAAALAVLGEQFSTFDPDAGSGS